MKLALALIISITSIASAYTVVFDTLPRQYQLYQRDPSDSGTIVISGKIIGQTSDSLALTIYENRIHLLTKKNTLIFNNDSALFSVKVRLESKLSEYRICASIGTDTVLKADSVVCGDVYVMTGQSNAAAGGTGAYDWEIPEWIRSVGYTKDSTGQKLLPLFAKASYKCCFLSIKDAAAGVGMLGGNLGRLIATSENTPICIVNGALGGSHITQHQRNNANPTDTSTLYGKLLMRMRLAGFDKQVKAMLYYQGEFSYSFDTYPSLFDSLYKSWHLDYPALKEIYIQQINAGCNTYFSSAKFNPLIRNFQRSLGETKPDITVMAACGAIGFDGCHYSGNGYADLAKGWHPVYARDFYGKDSSNITSARILTATYSAADHKTVDLLFDMPVFWPADTMGHSMKDYITFDSAHGIIDSARTIGNTLRLYLSTGSNATTVSYIPTFYYWGDTAKAYMGPYIRNKRGLGTLTFKDYPITTSTTALLSTTLPKSYFSVTPNPVSGAARISFILDKAATTTVNIHDYQGRLIQHLSLGKRLSGHGNAIWNLKDYRGAKCAPGIYLISIKLNGQLSNSRKISILN
ncbi:MAG: T9SS type A sorting domain-containing protein [Fibrobacteres bacterium]|nr:T9SS type A sorting domain-containing protein [Fibrobacterota bacterium]